MSTYNDPLDQALPLGNAIDCADDLKIEFSEFFSEHYYHSLQLHIDKYAALSNPHQQKDSLTSLYRKLHSLKSCCQIIQAEFSVEIILKLEFLINHIKQKQTMAQKQDQQIAFLKSAIELLWELRESIVRDSDERPCVSNNHLMIELLQQQMHVLCNNSRIQSGNGIN